MGIDMAVFPALQGGPHNHQIGGLACQLLEVNTPDFVEYSKNVKANAATLAEALMAKGHKLATDGTDNHLVLWDLRPHGLTGSKVEKVCEMASISLNRNAVHGDASAFFPRRSTCWNTCYDNTWLWGCGVQENCRIFGSVLPDCLEDPKREREETEGF